MSFSYNCITQFSHVQMTTFVFEHNKITARGESRNSKCS